MESSAAEVRRKLANSLKRYGFYIFTRDELQVITAVLASLNLHRILKPKPLGSKKNYFSLEIDEGAYISLCRTRCSGSSGFLDVNCYVSCVENSRRDLIDASVKSLQTNTKFTQA